MMLDRPRRDSAAVLPSAGRGLPVLMIVHQHRSNPGHVGRWFREHGHPLDIRLPRYGDPLPETLEGHCAAVIFGGPMSATDRDDYVRREIDWIDVPLRQGKPFLGICLGGQMLALKLGGAVSFDADGYAEIGYHPIRPTEAGRSLFQWPRHVYHWHREGFTVPQSGHLLAEGTRFPNQAFVYGETAFGLQFHPEITQKLVNNWTSRAAHRLILPGAKPRADHVAGHLMHGPDQRRWLGDLLAKMTGLPASNPTWR